MKPNIYTSGIFKEKPLLNQQELYFHISLPFPQSHRGCGYRSSHCLYMQVSVCSSLNRSLEMFLDEEKCTAHI